MQKVSLTFSMRARTERVSTNYDPCSTPAWFPKRNFDIDGLLRDQSELLHNRTARTWEATDNSRVLNSKISAPSRRKIQDGRNERESQTLSHDHSSSPVFEVKVLWMQNVSTRFCTRVRAIYDLLPSYQGNTGWYHHNGTSIFILAAITRWTDRYVVFYHIKSLIVWHGALSYLWANCQLSIFPTVHDTLTLASRPQGIPCSTQAHTCMHGTHARMPVNPTP